MQIELRAMIPDDWPAVREIYRQGIDTGDATFEREVPDWEAWDARRHSKCRFVAESDGTVVGFACVSPSSKRAVYAGVCEVMVYVAEGHRGQGIGSLLMTSMVEATEAEGIWMLQAGIFSPRTLRRSGHTSASGSAWSAPVSASADSTTVAGATRFSWSAAARSQDWSDREH